MTGRYPVTVDQSELAIFGQRWTTGGQRLSKQASIQFGSLLDLSVGRALAVMLGGIPVVAPISNGLTPPSPATAKILIPGNQQNRRPNPLQDYVEVGPVRIIGGVRPQNFDVDYRPDGVRFAFDSKSLNDRKSIGKNWQNMLNDIATEATTVHSRFPYALVTFMVFYPEPAVSDSQRIATIGTLERLARRVAINDPDYMAEAISLVLWNPVDGTVDPALPDPASPLRIERFSSLVGMSPVKCVSRPSGDSFSSGSAGGQKRRFVERR